MATFFKVLSIVLLICTGGFWTMWIIYGPSFFIVVHSFCAPILSIGCWNHSRYEQ